MKPEEIKRIRKRLKLSQGELAQRLDVSSHSVWKWEDGRSTPSGKNLLALYEVLSAAPVGSLQIIAASRIGAVQQAIKSIRDIESDIDILENEMLKQLTKELLHGADALESC